MRNRLFPLEQNNILLTLSLMLTIVFLSTCTKVAPTGSTNNSDPIQQNSPPSSPNITVGKSTLQSGESTNLSATVNDPDGDPITYSWNATGGSFNSTTQTSVVWTAPAVSSSQTYTITLIVSDNRGASNNNSINIVVTPQYSSVTGVWRLETRSGFGNDEFTAGMSVNGLNLNQTNQLAPGYSSNVYIINGSFTEFGWLIQRKSDGETYLLQNASGSIAEGAINANMTSHNLQFYLASKNFFIKGVAPGYASMWGDVTLSINMTNIYGTNDGTITLTGMWDANRK